MEAVERPVVRRIGVLCALATVMSLAVGAAAPAAAYEVPFRDVTDHKHRWAIIAIADVDITGGCNRAGTRFCPERPVQRDQMASFLQRALGLAKAAPGFADVPRGSTHARTIGAIRKAGISNGCRVEGRTRYYCPRQDVTRAEMASFLQRALDLPDAAPGFADVRRGSTHARAIGAIRKAGVTEGCRTGSDGTAYYCPDRAVSRAEMAVFLTRALGLDGRNECASYVTADTRPRNLGAAATSFPANAAEEVDGKLYVASLGLDPSRVVVYDLDTREVERRIDIPLGSRTWAMQAVGDMLYVGQWNVPGGEPNLFRLATTDPDAGFEAVTRVPTNQEFWDLTSDADGNLYAVTDTRRRANGQHVNVVHRIDAVTEEVSQVEFTWSASPDHDNLPPQTTQVAWADDGTPGGTLYVGLGRGEAHLFEVDPPLAGVDPPPQSADELAANTLARATGIYDLVVTADRVLVGTEEEVARLVAVSRDDHEDVAAFSSQGSEGALNAIVADEDGTVHATGKGTGWVYQVDLSDPPESLERVRQPLPRTPARHAVLHRGEVFGTAASGHVWTLDDEPYNLMRSELVTGGPEQPQSLSVLNERAVVGTNNAVEVHDGSSSTRHRLSGEVKAMRNVGGATYLATYPNGTLWGIGVEGGPSLVTDWPDDAQFRPRDVDWEPESRRILVATKANAVVQGGALISISPATRKTTNQITDPFGARSVESVTILRGTAYVGSSGHTAAVRAFHPTNGKHLWGKRPGGDRDVGAIVGLAAGADRVHGLTANGYWFTLDPHDGDVLRAPRKILGSGDALVRVGHLLYAANRGTIKVIDPFAGTAETVHSGLGADPFGRAPLTADTSCRLYALQGRNLVRFDP